MFTDLWYSFMTYASQSYRVHLLKLSAICQLHLNKTGRKVKTKFCFFNQSVVSFSFFGVCVCVCVCVCGLCCAACRILVPYLGIKPVPPYGRSTVLAPGPPGKLKKKTKHKVFLKIKWK